MTPLVLFSEPRARARDPRTSHAAAAAQSHASLLERGILHTIGRFPHGLTDDELCAQFVGLHDPTVKTARSRLSKRGLLTDSGARRPSVRGREMIVWVRV